MSLSSKARVSGATGTCADRGRRCSVPWKVSAHTVASLVMPGMCKIATGPDREKEKATQQITELDLHLTSGDTKLHLRDQEFQFCVLSVTQW